MDPATGMDVTGVVTAVENAGADITTVGMAIIGVAAVVFAFKWIKAAFF